MDNNNLIKLVDTILLLKAKVECPICLDAMQDAVELDCGHKYCKECFLEHKNLKSTLKKEVSCPLCKKVFKRRSTLYTDNYLNTLGQFVYKCCENIKTAYNCEVEQLQKKLKDELSRKNVEGNILQQNVGSKDNYATPSTSKAKQQNTNQGVKQRIPLKGKYAATSFRKGKKKETEALKENNENAFDRLIQAPPLTFNKTGTKQVYVNKKKLHKKEIGCNILDFHDDKNKADVIRWLNDTRNKFDRLSQTQNIVKSDAESLEVPVIDLLSVSQLKKSEDDFKPVASKMSKGRAKSLDIEINRVAPTPVILHSHGGSVCLENYNIEDINTEEEVVKKAEEKVILDLIEDEFLETLEHELQTIECDEFEVNSKRNANPKKKKKTPSSPSTTGWKRLIKMEKTMNKKVPKQLNITLQSTQELNTTEDKATPSSCKKNDGPRTADTNTKNEKILKVDLTQADMKRIRNTEEDDTDSRQNVVENDKVAIENKSRPPEQNEDLIETTPLPKQIIFQRSRQSYDLQKVENYIENNMEIIDKNSTGASIENKSVDVVDLCVDKVNTVEKSSVHSKSHIKQDYVNSKDDSAIQQIDLKSNTTHKQPDLPEEDNSCVLLDVLFNMPTQRNRQSDDFKSPPKNEFIVINYDSPNEEKLPISPLRKKTRDSMKDDSLDEVSKLYASATQKVTHTCEGVEKEEKYDSVEDLLYLVESGLKNCLTNLKSNDLVVDQLQNIQFYLSKIKSLHQKNNELVEEKPLERNFCDADTQVTIEVIDEITQTEVTVNNIEVQTEVTMNNIQVQTEDIHSVKSSPDPEENMVVEDVPVISQNTKNALESMMDDTKLDFKPTLHSTLANKNISKPRTQNEIFTCSLDGLNFETQEIAKKQGTITKINLAGNSIKYNITQSKEETLTSKKGKETNENIPGSVLVCSLNSNKSSPLKKVNRKLSYDGDKSTRFKRIRQPVSDSDSEEEVPVKRKCNRFLRDDLTVEFLTNDKPGDRRCDKTTALETQNSDGINYDEYLSEVMKKYDDNNFSNNPSPLSKSKKPKVLTPKQETINRCEEMIANANQNLHPPKINEVSAVSSKDSYVTASDSICNNLDDPLNSDKIFLDEENLMKLENDIREYEKNTVAGQSSEIPDIIGGSEEVEPSPKRFKKTIVQKSNSQPKNEGPFSKVQESDKICHVVNEDLNDLEVFELDNEGKIKILANVKIKSQDRKEELKEQEDDLFSSDEDIVETTPQKKVHSFSKKSAHSPLLDTMQLIDNLPDPLTVIDNFDFGSAPLPPPPDFQDEIPSTPEKTNEEDNVTEENITIIPANQSSLTPDHLSQFLFRNNEKLSQHLSPCIMQFTKENEKETSHTTKVAGYETQNKQFDEDKSALTPNKQTQHKTPPSKRNISHSTPIVDVDLTRETLGFSPIPVRQSQRMGMTEMAQSAKYTPLSSVTKQTPQKQNLLTSTPRQKSMWNFVKPSQPIKEEYPSIVQTKPCVSCTRLSKEQVQLVCQLTHKKLATYNPQFNSSVTHMIVMTNDKNCIRDYTIKFVSAVASGLWVLRFQWVEDCLSKNSIVPEEPYEVLDMSGLPGPRTSRLTGKQNPLFRGYKFFCAEPFITTTRQEIEDILRMLDGKVLRGLRELLEVDGKIGIIIGEGHATQDFEQYERWLEQYKTVTVDIEWLSKSIGQYKILSIRPYMWCSEDNLGYLGYPPALTETVPLSFSETF